MAPTRERILDATAELFRRYGYTGTGLKQVVAAANAPFGSLYHHFPGGKQQLGAEVVHRAGHMYQKLVESVFDSGADAVEGTANVFSGAAEVLKATDYADACPIATVALEVASTDDTLRQATAEVFESWIQGATTRFADAGVPEARARELAILLVAALEGAFVLDRAMRGTEALRVAGAAAATAVEAALAG
ncbi:TetR/AcrR family transcriptional regulator [Amycolatopsis sp. K13G38]|uniref:TetR/AcrR family transcriptional regulator n=1 Tax=Amycolatopsis acididurans TaxID=2724524 RepID=A0ABX1J8Q3_9PSEU|nr:TetR/AcrR family transcriptional regulator [Amycolatopsis acididurans]NKQ54682.1 TetR/AcrR family transcriptional regulator [Amycolatopsis acididurans]